MNAAAQATNQRIVVIGATSAIAEHALRGWVTGQSANVVLVARDAVRCAAIAADLQVRSPASTFQCRQMDFLDATAIRALASDVHSGLPLNIVLIAHGSLPDQAALQDDLEGLKQAVEINGVSPALFAEAFAGRMQAANCGTLVIIGSVAGDRGRKSNYIYGAAKGLLERYAQGLQHRMALAESKVRVVLVKPGPTNTPMTQRLRGSGLKLAPVTDVAKRIVSALAVSEPVIYAPAKWRWIMLVLRHLPRRVFNHMDI